MSSYIGDDLKCPYCKKDACIPDVVFIHGESYGGGIHTFRCNHCDKVIEGITSVIVKVSHLKKTDKDSDW